jgi:hypothetical protein
LESERNEEVGVRKTGGETYRVMAESIEEMRELVVENNASLRELRGEFKEFKAHVMGRVERLEKKEGERTRHVLASLSLLASMAALVVSIIVNFFKHGR